MRHPFLCRPMTSTVKRRIKEHALIVWESMVPASEADCIAWERASLFFVRALRHPETAKPGKTSAASETFQRSASKEAPWQKQCMLPQGEQTVYMSP